ncbi:MAG: preprotein translocase, YajC subunit [Caulobacteraceae bacterium]|nr:preprotein translocase, YajC subunit [Caulobacteraceae bacterium]
MFAASAFAQTTAAGAAAANGAAGPLATIMGIAPFIAIFILAYFMILRPQQTRMKQHQKMVTGVKRGDTVVLNSGLIGKVVRVEDAEVGVEIATGVTVKVVKSMIGDVRVKGEVAANDAKS